MRCPGIIEQAFDKEICMKDAWLSDQKKHKKTILYVKNKEEIEVFKILFPNPIFKEEIDEETGEIKYLYKGHLVKIVEGEING